MPGNAAPVIWAGRGRSSACGKPTGTHSGRGHPHPCRSGPGHTPGDGVSRPPTPGGTFFCKLTASTKLHKRCPPGSGAPGPPAEGSAWTGAGARGPPAVLPPPRGGPRWPGLQGKVRDGLRLSSGHPRAGATRGLGARAGPGRPGGPRRPPAGPGGGGVEAGGRPAGGRGADNGPRAGPGQRLPRRRRRRRAL